MSARRPHPASTASVHSDGIVIRAAHAADLEALLALEQRSFSADRMSGRQYRRHLGSTSARILVASQPALLGSAVLFFRAGSTVARLYSLAVDDAVRGRGIGARLLHAAIEAARQRGCRSLRLEVRTDNAGAIALYECQGFRRIGRYVGYYEDGADAWRYERALGETKAGPSGVR